MAGGNGRALLLLGACVTLAVQCVVGTTYDVGGASRWIIPTSNAQLYTNWLNGKSFRVGDKLNFNFTTGAHNVEEVTKANYASCSSTGALVTYSTGPTTVTLNKTGNHYFICGIPTHCASGQKIELNVVAANSTSPTSTPSPDGNNSSASRLSTAAVTACISIVCGAVTLLFFL